MISAIPHINESLFTKVIFDLNLITFFAHHKNIFLTSRIKSALLTWSIRSADGYEEMEI